MKRKTLTLTLSILACLALIGVGFASWIISADAIKEAEGNIIVDTVADKTYVVSGSWLDDKSSITFGAPATMNAHNPWLTNDSEGKTENLTVTYQLTVKYGDNTPATGIKDKITALVVAPENASYTAPENASYTAPENASYTAAVNGGLIIAPKNATVEETAEGSGIYNITVTYKWGKHFADSADATEGVNPYTYYNTKTATDKLSGTETTYMQDAKTSLETLSKIEASVKFTLNITVKK